MNCKTKWETLGGDEVFIHLGSNGSFMNSVKFNKLNILHGHGILYVNYTTITLKMGT
jgi:hypothetical protein